MTLNVNLSSNESPLIVASAAATNYLTKQLSSLPNVWGIRLKLTKAGCSGFRHECIPVLETDDLLPTDRIISLTESLNLCVEKSLLPKLIGLSIDYQPKGIGGGELIFNNPRQTGACGCGESVMLDES